MGADCHTPMVCWRHDHWLADTPTPADPVGVRLRGRRPPTGRRHEVPGSEVARARIGTPVGLDGSGRRCRRHRRPHLGPDLGEATTSTRFRPGPTDRSTRRPRTGCAVPAIAGSRHATSSNRSITNGSSGRTAIPSPGHAAATSGPGGRRRGHHGHHLARGGARTHRIGLGGGHSGGRGRHTVGPADATAERADPTALTRSADLIAARSDADE